jgi:biopolymer transport protein TolR
MGASVKRLARGARHRPMGEINVTPFVDVMLVLLIVFMVTAPLLTVGVEVDLPKTQAGQVNADAAPLVVSMKANGSLYLQEAEVDIDALIPRLQAVSEANSDIRIFVRGDAAVTYGDILGVMGRIQAAGFSKVALVAKLPEIE